MSKLTKGQRSLLSGAAVVGVMLGGASVSWSLWSDQTSGDGLTASTGHLNLGFDAADATWTRTTGGYTTQLCGPLNSGSTSATCTGDATTVVTMPGDTFQYVVPISVDLYGQNLAGELSVQFADTASEAAIQAAIDSGDLTITYHLANPGAAPYTQAIPADGSQVPWGAATSLPFVSTSGAVGYNLIVDVAVNGDYQWGTNGFTDAQNAGGGTWTTGPLTAQLVQVRG